MLPVWFPLLGLAAIAVGAGFVWWTCKRAPDPTPAVDEAPNPDLEEINGRLA